MVQSQGNLFPDRKSTECPTKHHSEDAEIHGLQEERKDREWVNQVRAMPKAQYNLLPTLPNPRWTEPKWIRWTTGSQTKAGTQNPGSNNKSLKTR